jgi:hypothetical protein
MPDVFAVPPVRSHTDLGQEVHGSPDDIASDDQQQAACSAQTVITRMVELGMEVEEIERYR